MSNDFTVNTFCEAIQTSRPTIYRMIRAGELFAYKVRNSTRIPFDELARIQKKNQIKPEHTNQSNGCES